MLRVDGHTDMRPITGPQFKIELGAVGGARDLGGAILIGKGVSPQRLVAAGFGEFQPIDPGNTEEAYQPQPPHRAEADGAVR